MDYNIGRYAVTIVAVGLCAAALVLAATVILSPRVSGCPRHAVAGELTWRAVPVSAGTTAGVERVLVQIGDPVRTGDLLIRLDAESTGTALDNARGRLEAAKAELDAAEMSLESAIDQLEYARGRHIWTRSMYERGAVARMELVRTEGEREFAERLEERARVESEAAKREYDEARDTLALMEGRFDAAIVTAPADGFVSSLYAWEGGSFLRGEEMMTIVVAGEIYVRVSDMPDAHVELGMDVWIVALTPLPQVFTGYAAAYDAEGRVLFRLRLDGKESYRGLFVMGERILIAY
ncbi:MAG: biotin/lipoyl-binding protein [Deltaproteobacteria bacterium]|nr:biotin/lipoyl-binding protein [Candidatus Zymogenaceae bacterium]